MLESFGREWIGSMRNAFLIRDPAAVLASYAQKRTEVTLTDIGICQQRQLFEREADRLGGAPPVIEGADVLADPPRTLQRLCAALEIPYTNAMLSWPPGRRDTDGVWAPAWYESVERTTGFARTSGPDCDPVARRPAADRGPGSAALCRHGGAPAALSRRGQPLAARLISSCWDRPPD